MLYEFANVHELASRMRTLLDNPARRNELREGALKWAAGFDWEVATDQTLDLIYKTIDRWNERKNGVR